MKRPIDRAIFWATVAAVASTLAAIASVILVALMVWQFVTGQP
jgi:hypothetical protein